jgi:GABA permease
VLVIATSNIGPTEIDHAIGGRFGEDAEVRVVAPASGLSKLQWLTNAEDDARADASDRAEAVADALPADKVDTQVGDSDPLQAIDDALRTFDADQVVVVTRTADNVTWLEDGAAESARERFSVPITHVVVG